ncbi:hypothetical protein [Mobilicoccus sp.]|uniref:hypothetical protein n=1 Tax=Mobilicoccus sp. TaxID=2034349 RepID=UPI0028B1CADE|nr:hypothetical protein [Mobilicoccus sp.]
MTEKRTTWPSRSHVVVIAVVGLIGGVAYAALSPALTDDIASWPLRLLAKLGIALGLGAVIALVSVVVDRRRS